MEMILDKLRDKNLKITPQRVAILKFLNQKLHPTIDEIYSDVKKDFVSISLATIYKNLNILKEEDIVFEVNTQNSKIKYDLNLTPHIHKYCPKCNSLEDIFLNDVIENCNSKFSKFLGEDVLKSDILITAICKKCAN